MPHPLCRLYEPDKYTFYAEAKDMCHQGTGEQEEQTETRLKLSSDVCLEYPTGPSRPQGPRSVADEQKSTD